MHRVSAARDRALSCQKNRHSVTCGLPFRHIWISQADDSFVIKCRSTWNGFILGRYLSRSCVHGKSNILTRNGYSPSMVGWTRVGREIHPLTSLCPSNVQCLSKGLSATRSVQSLSNSCQIPVQSNTTWTDIGRKTLISSTLVLSATIYYLGQSLDKLAPWTMCWHGLDLLT